MPDITQLKAKVDAAVKRADSGIVAERSFFDEISDRLFVTIVKGSRKTEFVLRPSHLTNGEGDTKEIDRTVQEAVTRLQKTPIG
ncbi:MAG TPA: hypothetical protein VKM94_12505 [Blastocatellia bacterium]|nr:hypothetical protein [Blastocatellia bacterium]